MQTFPGVFAPRTWNNPLRPFAGIYRYVPWLKIAKYSTGNSKCRQAIVSLPEFPAGFGPCIAISQMHSTIAGDRGTVQCMNLVLVHITVTLASIAFLLMAMAARHQHRSPQSAFAWLLFTAVVPYLGVPAYLALGNRKSLPSKRQARFEPGTGAPAPTPLASAINKICHRSGLPNGSSGNNVVFLETGSQAHGELARLIDTAEKSLDLVFYRFDDDEIGHDVVERLIAKAEGGVNVRVLLDGYGSLFRPHRHLARLEQAGGELRIFSPLAFYPVRGHVNLRNHRKMVIADNSVVFAGGMNVGRQYMGRGHGQSEWTDLAYLLQGPCVRDHDQLFAADWARAEGETAPNSAFMPAFSAGGGSSVQMLPSGPDIAEDVLHDVIVLACYNAMRRITIVTPYFLPSSAISGALSIAARRGVDVTLIVPNRSNQRLADLGRASFLREMNDAGVKVLVHPEMVHAKAMLFDDFAMTGSANLDIRSLYVNFEAMLLLFSQSDAQWIAQWMARLASQCCPWLPVKGRLRKLPEILFRLAAPLM